MQCFRKLFVEGCHRTIEHRYRIIFKSLRRESHYFANKFNNDDSEKILKTLNHLDKLEELKKYGASKRTIDGIAKLKKNVAKPVESLDEILVVSALSKNVG